MPGPCSTASAWAALAATPSASVTAASSTNHTPSGKRLHQLGGHLQGQAGLAASPRPGDRHQPLVADQGGQLGDLGGPADEGGALDRQVVGAQVQGAQRRELVLQVGVAQLEHPLGAGQVLQPVHPQIAQARPVGQIVGHQLAGRPPTPPSGRRGPGCAAGRCG